MAKKSAGILLYRYKNNKFEILLVHPGGPFWAKKDKAAWSIPKGEFTDEDGLTAAKREFKEETGLEVPPGELKELGSAKQSGGKTVFAWKLESDLDIKNFRSNSFEMEWPPRSGKKQVFPETDKAAWMDIPSAKVKIVKGQVPLIETLEEDLGLQKSELEQLSLNGEGPQTQLF